MIYDLNIKCPKCFRKISLEDNRLGKITFKNHYYVKYSCLLCPTPSLLFDDDMIHITKLKIFKSNWQINFEENIGTNSLCLYVEYSGAMLFGSLDGYIRVYSGLDMLVGMSTHICDIGVKMKFSLYEETFYQDLKKIRDKALVLRNFA